jgi:hypothetical protein
MTKPSEHAVEGRASLARPSLCLLAFALVACLAVNATTAHAAPKELTLSGTSPRSTEMEPAGSTTPRVRGSDEGIGKSVIHFGLAGRPVSSASSPTNIVKVFIDSECKTTPVGTGTYNELEGEGIQVEVAPDSVTTFYATQAEAAEPANPSPCSKKGVTYYESSSAAPPSSEPPPSGGTSPSGEGSPGSGGSSSSAPVPPRLHTVPGGRANNNTPSVVGSAPGASQVKIFANSGCVGAPLATVAPGELSAGVPARVPDNSVTDFAAISLTKGKQSFCSTAATYIEDSSPPRVRITMGPGAKTRRHKAVFRFADISGESIGTSFSCRVNRGKWKPCFSPFKLKHLHFRRYVLKVRATDDVGNTEAKPSKRSFKVIH